MEKTQGFASASEAEVTVMDGCWWERSSRLKGLPEEDEPVPWLSLSRHKPTSRSRSNTRVRPQYPLPPGQIFGTDSVCSLVLQLPGAALAAAGAAMRLGRARRSRAPRSAPKATSACQGQGGGNSGLQV